MTPAVCRSLKHLITLKLQRIRISEEAARAAGAPVQDNAAQFCCPITGQELNGRFPFVIMRHTGHVISRRALREVSTVAGFPSSCQSAQFKKCHRPSLVSLILSGVLQPCRCTC